MNSKFIIQFQEPDEYYIKYDSHPNPEYVYFIKEDTLHSLKPKEIKDLNSFIYWTVYTTKSTGPLNGLELFDYLKNYEIIFVDKEVFYKMWPGYRIE